MKKPVCKCGETMERDENLSRYDWDTYYRCPICDWVWVDQLIH